MSGFPTLGLAVGRGLGGLICYIWYKCVFGLGFNRWSRTSRPYLTHMVHLCLILFITSSN